MAYFMRSPTLPRNSREVLCSHWIDPETGKWKFVHSAPLLLHDRCAKAQGLENRSPALEEAWRAAKAAIRADHAARGEINPPHGGGLGVRFPRHPARTCRSVQRGRPRAERLPRPAQHGMRSRMGPVLGSAVHRRSRRATLLRLRRSRRRTRLDLKGH